MLSVACQAILQFMGALTSNIGPPAALYCIQVLGLILTSGAKGAQIQRCLLSHYR